MAAWLTSGDGCVTELLVWLRGCKWSFVLFHNPKQHTDWWVLLDFIHISVPCPQFGVYRRSRARTWKLNSSPRLWIEFSGWFVKGRMFTKLLTFELDTQDGRFVQEAQLTFPPPLESESALQLLDAVSHPLQRLSNVTSLWCPALFGNLIFLLEPPTGGAHCLQVYYVRSPSLDPQPFSAKFHQQTCSSSRRPTACRNLESIKQPAGGGRVGGADGGGKWKKWGDGGEKEQNTKIVHIPPFCLALLPHPSFPHTHTHTHTHTLACELPLKIQTTPQAVPAFFFYVSSTILQVLFLMGHKQTAVSAV